MRTSTSRPLASGEETVGRVLTLGPTPGPSDGRNLGRFISSGRTRAKSEGDVR